VNLFVLEKETVCDFKDEGFRNCLKHLLGDNTKLNEVFDFDRVVIQGL